MFTGFVGDLFELSAAAVGATALIVFPRTGPVAYARERWVRPVMGKAEGVLDCYLCLSFWMGLGFGMAGGEPMAALVAPGVVWGWAWVRGSGCRR